MSRWGLSRTPASKEARVSPSRQRTDRSTYQGRALKYRVAYGLNGRGALRVQRDITLGRYFF